MNKCIYLHNLRLTAIIKRIKVLRIRLHTYLGILYPKQVRLLVEVITITEIRDNLLAPSSQEANSVGGTWQGR